MYVIRAIAFLALLSFLIAAGKAFAADSERARFHIPAGHAATTLRMFAAQSNLNVLFQSDEVNTQRTKAVRGTLDPIEALKRMLLGSGLLYQFKEPNSVLVSAVEDSPSSADGSCGPPLSKPCKAAQSESAKSESTVTVTGLLLGSAFDPGQVSALEPYLTLRREDFATGGFHTVGDALRSLPQNFGGGLNVGVIFAGGTQNTTSLSAASTVNLRGLGSGSTLVLINGQRVASAEGSGAADVSLIPISAVERIDIIPGSASAQYGSDAVAGIIDIIIRTDFQGVELSAARGIATEHWASHGNSLQRYSAAAGDTIKDVKVFGTVDCAWQREIDSQQRDYLPADIKGTTLLPGLQRCSTLFSAAGSWPRGLEASVLGAYTTRSVYQVASLMEEAISTAFITRSDVHQYAVNGILKQHFLNSWTVTLSGGLSSDDVSSEELFAQSGVLNPPQEGLVDNRLWTAQIIASGTMFKARAGPMRLSLGAGYDQQGFLFANLSGAELPIAKRRGVRFAFVESAIPLVPSFADMTDPTALSLDVTVRKEKYDEVGETTNSKIALTFKPVLGVKVQASWGQSFRAPTLLQQFGTPEAALEFVPDAASPNGQTLALVRFGGNSLLEPERSTDVALDLVLTPEALPGASLRLSYFSIFYHQRIDHPTLNTADPLSDPNAWPFVNRNPSSGAISQVLAQSGFTDLTEGQYTAQEAAVVVDDRYQNFVRQRASGVDFLGKYDWATRFGMWNSSLNVAYLDLQQQITNETALTPLSGTIFNPPVWRGRFGINWGSKKGYLASLFVNYTGGSRGVDSPGQQPVPIQPAMASWTTVDAQIGMVFDRGGRWGSSKVSLFAENLFDRDPPPISRSLVSPGSVNYDSTNTSPVGRFLTLQVMQVW